MKRYSLTYIGLALLSALALLSCEHRYTIETGKEESNAIPIRWKPYSRNGSDKEGKTPSTKAFVDHDEDLMLLCTPSDQEYDGNPGGGNGIGFWADYLEYSDGHIHRTKNVFGYDETKLIYLPELYEWDYLANDLFWSIGGKYKIRAYFPQSVSEYIIKESSNSDMIAMEYNTHLLQEDVLMSYNEIHTNDPYLGEPSMAISTGDGFWPEELLSEEIGTGEWRGFNMPFSLNDPIPLFFDHVMAAVRVRFCFTYDDSDVLLGCSFANKDVEDGFHTVGVLLYGDSENLGTTASNMEHKWISYQSSFDDVHVFSWEVADEEFGIPFSRATTPYMVLETMAIPFSKYGKQVISMNLGFEDPDVNEDDAFDTPIPLLKESPPYYNENDGWIIVIPQEQKGKVKLNFKTKNSGEMSVDLPIFTGTREDGTMVNDPTDTSARYLLAGHRYTYTVRIRKTDIDVSVDIEPWNKLFVTHDIVL